MKQTEIMLKMGIGILLLVMMFSLDMTAQTAAWFSAEEAQVAYYKMGWDSAEETATWSYSPTASGNFTWHLEPTTPYTGQPAFSSIDGNSKTSLCVRHNDYTTQNEVAASPTIEILPNSVVEFYACFRSVFLFDAPWYFYVIDLEGDSVAYKLDAFMWSQANAFTGPSWQKFVVDLSAYEGMKASFAFQYTGPGGEDLAIDGFRLLQNLDKGDAVITINEGEQVHYLDRSTGNVSQWRWEFMNGSPRISFTQNPVVTYDKAGTFSTTLTVTDKEGLTDKVTRAAYVNVVGQAPKALIGLPSVGYLSPWVARFVPVGATLDYHDLSSGKPSQWHWTFEGGTPSESDEQHPQVTYHTSGCFGMTLDVSNDVGTSQDFMVRAIQVGGGQYIWNIDIDEYDNLGEISLGSWGYYGGSNMLGIEKFAEHFDAPATTAVVDTVQVYFNRTKTVTPNQLITIEVCVPDAAGRPGEVLGTAACKASELAYDSDVVVPTTFVLNRTVTLNSDFFVVVSGIPHNTGDAISMLSLRRGENGKTTTWHLLEDEDPVTYSPLGTYTWYKNDDDAVSFCLTPYLTYQNGASDIVSARRKADVEFVYGLSGQRVSSSQKGIRIIRKADGSARKTISH